MGAIDLSILVPSVHTRRSTHLPNILNRLYGMWEELDKDNKARVEILTLVDNKQMMLGEKRNEMVRIAQGQYVVFVDDDDRIEDEYIAQLLEAIWSGPDVVTFQVKVSINSQPPKICHYDKDYEGDYNTPSTYHRLPNHICCVKKEIASKVSFPNIAYGEDAVYAKLLKPHLNSQVKIEKVLYHYDYSEIGTETQQQLTNRKARVREGDKPLLDLVILSKADNPQKKIMTQTTIDTAISGANGLPIRVIVVEQVAGVEYDSAATYYKAEESFNYNRFMNFGASKGDAPWIMPANNDLVFSDSWLHHLMAARHPVVSPKCPVDTRQQHVTTNSIGVQNGVFFSGWCFMIDRGLFEEIGGLDEDVSFWCSDDATIEQVRAKGIEPMLVPAAQVRHLGSTTLLEQDRDTRDDLCWGQVKIFNEKYKQNKFENNLNYQEYLRRQEGNK